MIDIYLYPFYLCLFISCFQSTRESVMTSPLCSPCRTDVPPRLQGEPEEDIKPSVWQEVTDMHH